MQTRFSMKIAAAIRLCLAVVAAVQCGQRSVQTFDEAEAAYERSDYAAAMEGLRVHAEQGHTHGPIQPLVSCTMKAEACRVTRPQR